MLQDLTVLFSIWYEGLHCAGSSYQLVLLQAACRWWGTQFCTYYVIMLSCHTSWTEHGVQMVGLYLFIIMFS